MDIKVEFGKNLKFIRNKKGLSQEKLANIAGLDRTYIPSIEKGVRNPSLVVIGKLASALDIHVGDFFKEPYGS